MKKLLTIFLLLVMTVQVTGFAQALKQEISFLHECEEKSDKPGEDKKEKEYVTHTPLRVNGIKTDKLFYSHHPYRIPHHVSDQPTPPPDALPSC